jgi:hypothetical protein
MKIDPDFALGMESMDFVHGLGQEPIKNPFIWSSACWLLFEAGRLWANGGRSAPIMARKLRGYSVKVQTSANDFLICFNGADLIPTIKRL